MSLSQSAKTDIRELTVLLAMADMAWGEEGDYQYDEYGNYGDAMEYEMSLQGLKAPTSGPEFIERCRFYSEVIQNFNPDKDMAAGDDVWEAADINLSRRGYAFGRMLGDYFGIYPGSIDYMVWSGPTKLRDEKYWELAPADIGFKYAGTPERDYDTWATAYENDDYYFEDERDEEYIYEQVPGLVRRELPDPDMMRKYDYYDTCDVAISLKDNSDILGNLGFGNFARMMLDEVVPDGTDFFDVYAPEDYQNWFRTALDLCFEKLADDLVWEVTENGTTSRIESDGFGMLTLVRYKRGQCVGEGILEANDELYDFWQLEDNARKVFAKWINKVGRKEYAYQTAQRICSQNSTNALIKKLVDHETSERFYRLVGYRMTEYYYGKIDPTGIGHLYMVPTYSIAAEYGIDVQLGETATGDVESDDEGNERVTAYVPFTMTQPDYGVSADFVLVIRFTDGQFVYPPGIKIHTCGEKADMYVPLYEESLRAYL